MKNIFINFIINFSLFEKFNVIYIIVYRLFKKRYDVFYY